jgi:hypothetical protein
LIIEVIRDFHKPIWSLYGFLRVVFCSSVPLPNTEYIIRYEFGGFFRLSGAFYLPHFPAGIDFTDNVRPETLLQPVGFSREPV